MATVSTHSIIFQALQLPQLWPSLKIYIDVDSGLTSCFIQPLFTGSVRLSCLENEDICLLVHESKLTSLSRVFIRYKQQDCQIQPGNVPV